MKEIKSIEELNGVNCLLMISAPWCGPCKGMKPIVEQVEKETGVPVLVANDDELPEVAARFGARGVPHFIALNDMVPVKRASGSMHKAELLKIAEAANGF